MCFLQLVYKITMDNKVLFKNHFSSLYLNHTTQMQPKINRNTSQKSRRTRALPNQQNVFEMCDVMRAIRMCFEKNVF